MRYAALVIRVDNKDADSFNRLIWFPILVRLAGSPENLENGKKSEKNQQCQINKSSNFNSSCNLHRGAIIDIP